MCIHLQARSSLGASATLLLGENVTTGVNTIVPAGAPARLGPAMGDYRDIAVI